MSRSVLLGLVVLSALLVAGTASARQEGLGLGLIVGEPTGVSGKLWLSQKTALDAAVAWSTEDEGDLRLQADYVWHDFNLINVDRGALPVYYGIGGRLRLGGDQDHAGVRLPVGVAYIFQSSRADIFFEVAPALDLTPNTDVNVDGGVGVRYFFH